MVPVTFQAYYQALTAILYALVTATGTWVIGRALWHRGFAEGYERGLRDSRGALLQVETSLALLRLELEARAPEQDPRLTYADTD